MLSLTSTLVESDTPGTQSFLDQAQAGDADAFGEVCRVYESRLIRQAMTLCGNITMAEDLAQDALVEAWKSLRRYNGRCRFFTWLCAILLNRFRNTLREKRPLPFSSFAAHDSDQFQKRIENVPASEPLPDRASELHEQALLLYKCLQALPLKHQQVVYLRFYVDDSIEGIAAALGCSIGTVKSRLFNALEKLRSMRALNSGHDRCNSTPENL
jgi:RNA polymerase sigma-70 factor, ECF subfamily